MTSEETALKAIKPDRSLADQVYETIRESIINGRLVPGNLYSVKNLAEMLNVSRTPVREALIELAEQGMVEFERNRGVRILQTTLRDLEEIFALRIVLETAATRRATELFTAPALRRLTREFKAMGNAAEAGDEQKMMEHDRRFHDVVLEMSGNERLTHYVDQLRILILTRGLLTTGRSRSLQDVVAAHHRILTAIEGRDPDAAAEAMREHILSTGVLLIAQEDKLGEHSTDLETWAETVRTTASS